MGKHRRSSQPRPPWAGPLGTAAAVTLVLLSTPAIFGERPQPTAAVPGPHRAALPVGPREADSPATTTPPPVPSPAVPTPTPAPSQSAPSQSAPSPTPSPRRPTPAPENASTCSTRGPWGTQPHVTQIGHLIEARFGLRPSQILGWRATALDRAGHPAGLALDFMVDRATGDRISAYLLERQTALGVRYVIWRQRITLGDGWDVMSDRGSVTANHYDHVHASFLATDPGPILC